MKNKRKLQKRKQKEKNLDNANIIFEVKDFKDIKDKQFTKICSIGQMEHSLNYKDYFKKIYDLLTENGIAVIPLYRVQYNS